jgi:hypothetical protein
MRFVLCVPAISAVMITALIGVANGASPVAAADCLTEPNRDAPAGQHWYYHLDRAADRKCWYLHATATAPPDAPAMELQSVRAQRRQSPSPELRRQAAPAPAAELQRQQAAAPQRPAPRSEAEEAALYLEFLRWKEQHRGEP